MPPSSPPLTPARSSRSSLTAVHPQPHSRPVSASYQRPTTSVSANPRPTSSVPAHPRPVSSAGSSDGTPFPRVHERAHLGLFSRACPTLRSVFFLSGAEWVVHPRAAEKGGSPRLPPFEFLGYIGSET